MKVLSDKEKENIDAWLKSMETGASDFCSATGSKKVREYLEGEAEAYGHIRKIFQEEEEVSYKLDEYLDHNASAMARAKARGEKNKAVGRYRATVLVFFTLNDVYENQEYRG